MADVVVFGTEEELCPEECGHTVGIHSRWADGCSRIDAGGWCQCHWFPNRSGTALLLETSVQAGFGGDF